MADESKAMSQAHQKWILDTLNAEGGSCTYEKLVEVGETKHCDTVGAMLKCASCCARAFVTAHRPDRVASAKRGVAACELILRADLEEPQGDQVRSAVPDVPHAQG